MADGKDHGGEDTVVVLQSSDIPGKGCFDLIVVPDLLAIIDDAQFTRRDRRNRNQITLHGQPSWLPVPSPPRVQAAYP